MKDRGDAFSLTSTFSQEFVMHVIYVGSRCAFKGKPSCCFVPVEASLDSFLWYRTRPPSNNLGVKVPGSAGPVWSDEVLQKKSIF